MHSGHVNTVTSQNGKEEGHLLQNLYVREKIMGLEKDLGATMAGVVEKRMREWTEENLPLLEHLTTTSSPTLTSALTRSHSTSKGKKDGKLPSRVFVARPSLLTELLTVNHIDSIYNIFVAILILLFFNKILDEIVQTGSLSLDLSLISWAFSGLDRVIVIWVAMFMSTSCVVYLTFHHWAHNRHNLPRVYDTGGGILFMGYLSLFLALPLQSLLYHNLPPASSIIVLCEQVRMFMKTWAFVRSNIGRPMSYKKDDDASQDQKDILCPDFSHYLYFLFVPTLVYRDQYPRNESCNWRKVVHDLGHVIGCLFYTHFIFVRFCVPVFRRFGQEPFTGKNLMVGVFSCMFPGSLVLLCAFFSVLHAWMNAFGEMLRFADRMFYKDWWNSTSYARFYRTWNCVVHDWLYEYVYKEVAEWQDLQSNSCSRGRWLPMMVVFFISSIVHEYILALAFRFFYPVLLVMFGGFGVGFMFVNSKERKFNVFLWVTLFLGTGLLMCLYSIEWYARINCPPVYDSFLDYIVPRSWTCINTFE
ncbi:sterol O-acyltransferase 1 isoform X2 [Oratosquilla oratoria]|uniref:sterol O-acyltransferase 1 isoform X2 n=1 Tax=Oratosquilla oratoria TaxID=337810 RepID=UPI003F76C407